MEIRAEINGWFRRMEVRPSQVNQGYIDVEIRPPFNILATIGEPVEETKRIVRLYPVGSTGDGRPWFRYDG